MVPKCIEFTFVYNVHASWYVDSWCSKHMTRKKSMLLNYKKVLGPEISFGNNSVGKAKAVGCIKRSNVTFKNVTYVKGLKHNLISISQLCDDDNKVMFEKKTNTIFNPKGKSLMFGRRIRNIYLLDMDSVNRDYETCFYIISKDHLN